MVWKANAIWLNYRCPQRQFEIMSSERCLRKKKSIAEGPEGAITWISSNLLFTVHEMMGSQLGLFFSLNFLSLQSEVSISVMQMFTNCNYGFKLGHLF